MGDYFADKWDALISLPAAIAENAVFFGIVFVIFLPLIWWQWRVTGNSVTHATESLTHCLRASADTKQVKHETGFGVQDVRVMRPPKTPGVIYFALFFFEGGALFYWLIVLQSGEATSRDWWTFAALSGFAIGANFSGYKDLILLLKGVVRA